jgi:hypothetical protein
MSRHGDGGPLDQCAPALTLPLQLRGYLARLQVLDRRYHAALAKLTGLSEVAVNLAGSGVAAEQTVALSRAIDQLEAEIVKVCDEKVRVAEAAAQAVESCSGSL